MLSQLGPLFKATFRQAESTDTRQAIKHYEKDNGQKKREHEKKQEKTDLWEDSTSVSTQALHAFLVNFLKTLPKEKEGSVSKKRNTSEHPEEQKQEYRAPKTTTAARAMHAYQSMNEKTHTGSPPPLPKPDNMPETTNGISLLESSDVRLIHALIDDLKTLSEAGLETLTIQKADSFLESLNTAIKLEKLRH